MTQSLVGTTSKMNLALTISILSGIQPTPASSQGSDAPEFVRNISKLFHDMIDGSRSFSISETQGGVSSSGVLTLTGVMTAADTVTIGGTVLTGDSSTQDATHFKIGGSATATAANIATCINANTTLNTYLSASSALGVMTITCLVPGKIGNGISTAVSAGGSDASWGATYMASGAGTLYTSSCGF